MLQNIASCVLLLVGQKIMAHNHIASNDLSLATLLDDIGSDNNCDFILLQQDQEQCKGVQGNENNKNHSCFLKFGNVALSHVENSRAIFRNVVLNEAIISISKCPIVILPTSKESRLSQVLSVAKKTRLPMSLAVVTNVKSVKEMFLTETERVAFDVQLIFTNGTERENLYNPVRHNKRWNDIRVTHVDALDSSKMGPDGKLYGPDIDLLDKVAELTGVNFYYQNDRFYSGIIQRVENGTADVAISQPSVSYVRYKAAGDVSMTYGSRSFFMVAGKPKEIPASWTLIYPFDFYTWLLLALSIIVVAVSLIVLNQEIDAEKHGGHKAKGFHIFSISVITLISEALPPSWFNMRKSSIIANMVLFTWFMCGLLITFAYRSTLLASLVSVEKEEPADTFQSLLDNEMTLFMTRGWLTSTLMRDSPRETLREVYQRCVIEKNGYHDFSRMLPPERYQAIVDGKASYIAVSVLGYRHVFIRGEEVSLTHAAMYYRRKFPWRQEINKVIGMMFAGGLFMQHQSGIDYNSAKREREYYRTAKTIKEKKLGLQHTQLMWFVLVGGVAASAIVLGWELVRSWIMGDSMGNKVKRVISIEVEAKRSHDGLDVNFGSVAAIKFGQRG